MRGQTAMEYLFLVAGGLLFVTFIVLVIRGGVITETSDKLQRDVGTFFGFYAKDYVFFDNFDTNTADRWTEYGGDWTLQDGRYSATDVNLSLVGLTVSNFSYSVWLKTSGSAGIVFRAQNASYFYYATVDDSAETVTLYDWNGGIAQQSYAGKGDASVGLVLRVDAEGKDIEVFVNNQSVMTYAFPGGYFDRGIFGLISTTGTVEFDNVAVCAEAC